RNVFGGPVEFGATLRGQWLAERSAQSMDRGRRADGSAGNDASAADQIEARPRGRNDNGRDPMGGAALPAPTVGGRSAGPASPPGGRLTLRRRVSRYYVASGSGPIDRIKIDCVFGALKAAYWVAGIRRGGGPADLAVPSIVSDNFRILFCGIPKVASRSISTMLFGSPAGAALPLPRSLPTPAPTGRPSPAPSNVPFASRPVCRGGA